MRNVHRPTSLTYPPIQHPHFLRGAVFVSTGLTRCARVGLVGRVSLLSLCLLGIFCSAVVAQQSKRPRRAAPPTFEPTDGQDVFFANALDEGLQGKRPEHLGKKVTTEAASVKGTSSGAAPSAGAGWSRLISGATLEDTIKATRLKLDKVITQPAAFASGGNRSARREFVTLTAMFAIIVEFDGDVRWKSDAVAARDRCRSAAQVCKVGSAQAFKAAQATKDEIGDLIGGNSLSGGEATPNVWEQLANRSTLMQQLETLFDETIQPAVANDASFKSQADEILAAAEMSSAIAEILMKEGMEDGDDEDYAAYCKQIQIGARDVVDAIKQSSGGAARTAAGVISKACSECHEDYRG